jgi:hypothetical protein
MYIKNLTQFDYLDYLSKNLNKCQYKINDTIHIINASYKRQKFKVIIDEQNILNKNIYFIQYESKFVKNLLSYFIYFIHEYILRFGLTKITHDKKIYIFYDLKSNINQLENYFITSNSCPFYFGMDNPQYKELDKYAMYVCSVEQITNIEFQEIINYMDKKMKLIDLIESKNTFAKTISWVKTLSKFNKNQIFLGRFTDINDDEYEIALVDYGLEKLLGINKIAYSIQFYITNNENEFNIRKTNKGKAPTIISIVENESIKKLKEENVSPDIIVLSISLNPKDNTEKEIQIRKRAYLASANRVREKLNMNYVYNEINDSYATSILITKEQISEDELKKLEKLLSRKVLDI